MYDFDANTFEFPEMRCYNGYVATALPHGTVARLGMIEGEITIVCNTFAQYMYRIDPDARAIYVAEPFQTRAFVLDANVEVFPFGNRTLLACGTPSLIDPSLRKVKTMADYVRTGTLPKTAGRLLVSLEGATRGNTLQCRQVCPSPVTLTPNLWPVAGGPALTAANFMLPRRMS